LFFVNRRSLGPHLNNLLQFEWARTLTFLNDGIDYWFHDFGRFLKAFNDQKLFSRIGVDLWPKVTWFMFHDFLDILLFGKTQKFLEFPYSRETTNNSEVHRLRNPWTKSSYCFSNLSDISWYLKIRVISIARVRIHLVFP
jgi:hypothetical protein